jgi:hypothetical protein
MSFLQAVEIWVPQGAHLLRTSAAYGSHEDFATRALSPLLRKGEGLAGTVYASGRPEVWRELGPPFERAEPEQADALEAAVALPFYEGTRLTAVAVFLCGTRAKTSGCIELWEPNPLRELTHVDGYYGNLVAFERLSRAMRFQAGNGVPGLTWQSGVPMVVPDLAGSASFLRAQAAREHGVHSGLSIPLYRAGSVAQIVLFLSVKASPLARAFEVWMPDTNGHLHISEAFYEPALAGFQMENRSVEFISGSGLVGKVYESRLPLAIDRRTSEAFTGHVGTVGTGLELGVAFPIHDGRRVRAVVALLV